MLNFYNFSILCIAKKKQYYFYYNIVRNFYVVYWLLIDIIFITGTPKGQIPVLEVDGKMMCESMTIVRFIAREYSKFSN